MSTDNEHDANTAQTPIGYVSAFTMESLMLGNAVMAAILTRNDVSGVDRAIYAAPVASPQPAAQGDPKETK